MSTTFTFPDHLRPVFDAMLIAMRSKSKILVLGWPGDRMQNKGGVPQRLQDAGICEFRNQSESRKLRDIPAVVTVVLCTEMLPTNNRKTLVEAANESQVVTEPIPMGMIDNLLAELEARLPKRAVVSAAPGIDMAKVENARILLEAREVMRATLADAEKLVATLRATETEQVAALNDTRERLTKAISAVEGFGKKLAVQTEQFEKAERIIAAWKVLTED